MVAGLAGLLVVVAFGGDGVGAVLCAGALAGGHHRGAVAAAVAARGRVGCGEVAGGGAQAGEQQGAARGGDVGVPGGQGPDQGAVGELCVAPAPECFEQMMSPVVVNTLV